MPSAFTNTGTSSGTTTANLNPMQNIMNSQLFQTILGALKRGPTVTQAQKDESATAINSQGNANAQNIEETLAGQGYGTSGKEGSNLESNAIATSNAKQAAYSNLEDQANKTWQQMIGNAFRFNTPLSTTTTGQTTNTPSPFSDIVSGLGAAFG